MNCRIGIRFIVSLVSIVAVLTVPSHAFGKVEKRISGIWEGTVNVEGAELKVAFKIAQEPDDELTGTIDSPDQGVSGIPFDEVTFEESRLRCELKAIQLLYEGEMSPSGRRIKGSLTQGGVSRRLTLTRVMKRRETEKPEKTSELAPSEIERVVGNWMGTVEFSGMQMRIVFRLNAGPDSTLTAKMDSPDQGATGVPVDAASFQDGHLRLEIKSAMLIYEGDLSQDGSSIDGELRQHGMQLPLTLEQYDEIPEPKRPQEPKPPFPYDQEEVVYKNEIDDVTLAGTLTLPSSGGPFPAVLLITGSGAQDRNETVFGHKPFLVLADYLTRRGIAVLRVDDRGIGGSSKGPDNVTSENFAQDVLAGVKFLKKRDDIDPMWIGLLGHSEGGIIAPMVAVRSSDVAFILMVAGPGVAGEKILYEQGALIGKAEGISDEMIAAHRDMQEKMFAVLKEEKNDSVAHVRLRQVMVEVMENMPEEQLKTMGLSEDAVDAQINEVMSPWFRYFLTYDPKLTLMKVKCPVLAINGEKDMQVPPKENLRAIEKALKAGGNEDYTVKEVPGLNHLLQTAETGSVSEYGKIEETISPVALELIGDWIAQRVE